MKRKFWLMLVLLLLGVTTAAQAQTAQPIDYGDSVRGRIRDTDEGVFYTFSGSEGDIVTISVESTSADVYVQLGDEDGDKLVENDDISSTNLNALIDSYELPADGDYLIFVGAYDTGVFNLSLDSANTQTESTIAEIAFGDSVSGEAVDLDNPVVFQFSGEAGETVSISLSSDTIDPYLLLTDGSGNLLAENDDISDSNLNSYLEIVLPANGTYLIGVLGYESGPFELTLAQGAGDTPITTVSTGESNNVQTASDEIDNRTYYVEYPLPDVPEGSTITIDGIATGGDLDVYLGLFYGDDVVAENDDRDQSTTDSQIVYPNAEAGDYSVLVTRYGFEEGQTSGTFEVTTKVSNSAGGSVIVAPTGGVVSDPEQSGYPAVRAQPEADWTVLVYMGGDNNLEDGLLNDLDEFEIAGGSTDSVRIIALMDRSGEYDRSNGNWTSTRIFEVGADVSRDSFATYPPTFDTREIVDLGELDTSYANTLLDFLIWGIQNYPAKNYAISLNDHGGAWQGIVTDDTTGVGILTISDLQGVFKSALQQTGIDKFDLLINDACLMSSLEYYAAMAPYFDYVISSPEVTLNPSFDMTLLTENLNRDPNIDIGELGRLMVDKYLKDMQALSPDTQPVLGAAVTDLRQFDSVANALERFTNLINTNPAAYGSLLGKVRSNTYTYSFFMPEDQFGPATNIDIGHFMRGMVALSTDRDLANAAQGVLDSLDDILLYGDAGQIMGQSSSFYNIYFPERAADFTPYYFEQNPLEGWGQMLRGYFSSVSANPRAFRAPTAGAAAAPSLVPQVTITNVFPTEASINLPVQVSMEVLGRNISKGRFTVDQLQPDGSFVRVDADVIVTEVVEDGQVSYINRWRPGVDEKNFNWSVTLYKLTDGTTENFELLDYSDGIWSVAGRYRGPDQPDWLEVTLLFDNAGKATSMFSRTPGSVALAAITPAVGGEFQAYRSTVTPDGRVTVEPGTLYDWPEEGLRWFESPAPSGVYNLGFLIEAFGGATGFDSVTVTGNNDTADDSLTGYIDLDWGFTFQRPADWSDVVYFPDDKFLSANNADGDQFIYIYPVFGAEDDLEAIAKDVLGRYNVSFDDQFTPITVDGKEAAEFTFTYGDETLYTGRAFAVFIEDLELGLVFASEGADPETTEAIFNLLAERTTFYDILKLQEADTGVWGSDRYTGETFYPVRRDWLPGFERGAYWYYTPANDEDSHTFVAAEVLNLDEGTTGLEALAEVIAENVAENSGYFEIGTETYYGENNAWEVTAYTYEADDGTSITGRIYLSAQNNRGYILWFEAPSGEFDRTLREVFFPTLDGYRIGEVEEE